jgi:DNA-binding NtrC family response regulator
LKEKQFSQGNLSPTAIRHNKGMVRPCFLVIDREYVGSISTRKLVIETAKFNVITAYSSAEAIETLALFPAVTGIVLDAGMEDMPYTQLIRRLKQLQPKVPIIVISAPGTGWCSEADHQLESFDPTRLLMLLQSLVPAAHQAIEEHNEALDRRS